MGIRSDDIVALKEQRANVLTQMQDKFAVAAGESRDLTAEEQQEYDRMKEEFRSLKRRQEEAELLLEEEKATRKSLDTPVSLNVEGGEEVPQTLAEYRNKMQGERIQDSAEFRAAWYHSMSTGKLEDLDIAERRVLSKATAGAGLNLVPTSFRNEIINILRFMGPINQLAEEIQTDSGETLQVPSVSAHGVATWTAENAAYTASDEVFGQISLGAFKAARAVIVSEELLTDAAFNLEAYLAQELGSSLGVLEETAFATGDGTGKPLGIATAGNGITISQAATGNATSFTYAALVNFIFALPYQYRRNASWIMSDSAVKNFYTMVDSQARPLWAVNVAQGQADTFMGYPIYSSPDLAAVAASAKSGVFGDIRQAYVIRRVNGFALQRQNELYSNNGQVGFRGTERVDGRVRNASAAIVLQHSAT